MRRFFATRWPSGAASRSRIFATSRSRRTPAASWRKHASRSSRPDRRRPGSWSRRRAGSRARADDCERAVARTSLRAAHARPLSGWPASGCARDLSARPEDAEPGSGLEPGPQLQELERRMLNQDPALELRRASTAVSSSQRHRRRLVLAGAVLVGLAALALGLVLTTGDAKSPVVIPDSLVKIDPKTNKVVDVIGVGRLPVATALGGDFVWVVNVGDSTLTRVDSSSGDTRTIGGLEQPGGDHRRWQRQRLGHDCHLRVGHPRERQEHSTQTSRFRFTTPPSCRQSAPVRSG